MTTCSIDGCEKPAKARGWCVAHYTRWIRHGDPLGGHFLRDMTRAERFWLYVDKTGPHGCWVWTGSKNAKDYGHFADGNGGSVPAHRASYEMAVGPIPDGYQIDHLCRNHSCVRPEHLQAVTHTENQLRGVAFSGMNARKTHCVNGHELTPENSYGYKGRRQCKTCAREASLKRANTEKYRAERRRRYQEARSKGLSPEEARKYRS